MAPQITVLRPPACKHTLENSRRRGLFFSPGSVLYFSLRSFDERPNIPGALSHAIDCRKHRHRRVALHCVLLVSPRTLSDTRYVFPPTSYSRSLSSLSTSVRPTRCNKFAIVPHNCCSHGRGIPRPDLGGGGGGGDLAPRATGISRGLPGILPCH